MKTIEMLLAHFGGSPIVSVENVAQYLQYKPESLKQKISRGEIRLPCFALEPASQKATKFVMLQDLANLIDGQYHLARSDYDTLWAEHDSM